MRKLLLSTVAAAALVVAAPADALANDGVKLDLGGYYKGYLGFADQDKNKVSGVSQGEIDSIGWLQDSEIHFTGETTLDNGLTVGAHFELEADSGDAGFQESYAYFSGDWGRFNLGAEDGAAFLLQVAAPSADSNYDGVRQYINPFNYGVVNSTNVVPVDLAGHTKWDYAQDPSGYAEKITYLSPVFSGFQVGVSYSPDIDPENGNAGTSFGFPLNNQYDGTYDVFGAAYEGAVRYEGQFDEIGFILGGGYSLVEVEGGTRAPTTIDDRDVWNLGADVNFRSFGLGVVYKSDDQEQLGNNNDKDTLVVGVDYTTGPFKLGASWLTEQEDLSATTDLDTDRYTGGVVYEYGPGMTFRGSLSYVSHDTPVGEEDIDGTTLLLGTQINF